MNRAYVWGVTVAITCLLAAFGPWLDATGKTVLTVDAATARFERGAQAICGPNAAWERVGDDSIQCFTHRGHKTLMAVNK